VVQHQSPENGIQDKEHKEEEDKEDEQHDLRAPLLKDLVKNDRHGQQDEGRRPSRHMYNELKGVDELSSSSVLRVIVENVTLCIEPGSLVCIYGPTGALRLLLALTATYYSCTSGCGKSTLLQGMLGECVFVDGEAAIGGQVAFVNQKAWIQNATLRENVLCKYVIVTVTLTNLDMPSWAAAGCASVCQGDSSVCAGG
jgi:ATPase subunit of ABC transporter with duplicated ATPase domains